MKMCTQISDNSVLPLFDGHCDTLTALDGRYGRICLDLENESFFPRGQIFAVCADISPRPHDGMLEECADRFSLISGAVLCHTREEFIEAESSGKCAAVLAVEGAEVLDCDPSRLAGAWELGVRVVAPTWNIYNGLCGSCAELNEKGLTPAGVEFCAEAVHLGMKLDVSHASEPAAFDMLRHFPGAVFASHSNAFALCPNVRNVSDRLFCEIAENGGTVGINLYSPFLYEGEAEISHAAEHISHFAGLCANAKKHISLGCDLDGCDRLPRGFSASADTERIADALLNRGFDRQDIIDIFHDNLFGFIWERQES